jgi:hypothetical protein
MDRKLLEDFLAAIEESEKKYNTPELALRFLQEAGIVDANGKLTEYYRSS